MKMEQEIRKMLRPYRLTLKNVSVSDLVCAIMLVAEEPERIHAVQKEVYMVVAKERCCSWRAIESSVRRALEEAWKKNRRYMETMAGYPLDSCPTAAEFVFICASWITQNQLESMK